MPLITFRQFAPGHILCRDAVDYAMRVCQFQDHRVSQAHKDVNGNDNHYSPWISSHYCTSHFVNHLRTGALDLAQELLSIDKLTSFHRVFIPISTTQNDGLVDDWTGCVLNVNSRQVTFIDPKYDSNSAESVQRTADHIITLTSILNPYLAIPLTPPQPPLPLQQHDQHLQPQEPQPQPIFVPWTYDHISSNIKLYDSNQNDFDSGIYLITIFDMISHNVPAAFSQDDVHNIRNNLAYNILNNNISH
jgi:hypothetical protein